MLLLHGCGFFLFLLASAVQFAQQRAQLIVPADECIAHAHHGMSMLQTRIKRTSDISNASSLAEEVRRLTHLNQRLAQTYEPLTKKGKAETMQTSKQETVTTTHELEGFSRPTKANESLTGKVSMVEPAGEHEHVQQEAVTTGRVEEGHPPAHEVWGVTANQAVEGVREFVTASQNKRVSEESNVDQVRSALRQTELQIIDVSAEEVVEEKEVIETVTGSEIVKVLESEELAKELQKDEVARKEIEELKARLASLAQTVSREQHQRRKNTLRIKKMHAMFGKVEEVIRSVSSDMMERQSSRILKEMTSRVDVLIQKSVTTEEVVKQTAVKKEIVEKEREVIVEKIQEVIIQEGGKEAAEYRREMMVMKKKINFLYQKIRLAQSEQKGDPESEATIERLETTIKSMQESMSEGSRVRDKNVEEIEKIRSMVLKLDIKKDISVQTSELKTGLVIVRRSVEAVTNRITVEVERQQQEMAKVRERLVLTEERVVELGQDLKRTQTGVKELRELMIEVQKEQKSVKSEVVREAIKQVETRIESATTVLIEKHLKTVEVGNTKMVSNLEVLVKNMQKGLAEERVAREKSDTDVSNMKIQINQLLARKEGVSKEAAQEIDLRIRSAQEAIQKETSERRKSEREVRDLKELVQSLTQRVSQESKSVSVMVKESESKIISKVESKTTLMIDRLRERTEMTTHVLEKKLESLKTELVQEVELRRESNARLEKLNMMVKEIDGKAEENSRAIREMREETFADRADIRSKVESLEEKVQKLTDGLSKTAHAAGAACPEDCDESDPRIPSTGHAQAAVPVRKDASDNGAPPETQPDVPPPVKARALVPDPRPVPRLDMWPRRRRTTTAAPARKSVKKLEAGKGQKDGQKNAVVKATKKAMSKRQKNLGLGKSGRRGKFGPGKSGRR